MNFFGFDFDAWLAGLMEAGNNPVTLAIWLFRHGGWVVVVWAAGYVAALLWRDLHRAQADKEREFVMLAVDVPKNNEQTPKAAESIFSSLAGTESIPHGYDNWVKGELPDSFSFEIVSLGGYVQFLIQTPAKYRDLVEAAIYAQYPTAEIVEVEDYTEPYKKLKFPNAEYECWGTELKPVRKQSYPIRTWQAFVDSASQELKDPMATMLEVFSKMGPDEQLWFQIVVTAAENDWRDEADRVVKKLSGQKVETEKTWLDRIIGIPTSIFGLLSETLLGGGGEGEKKADARSQMQHLTPGERSTLEAIEYKMAKVGFHAKLRVIYLAKKATYTKSRAQEPIEGALWQFRDLGLNGFKKNKLKTTKVKGLFKDRRTNERRNKILRLYRNRVRLLTPGYYGDVLNIEELATLWHFPLLSVKAPLVKRAESKKAEPPISLPLEPQVPPAPEPAPEQPESSSAPVDPYLIR